MLAHVVSAAPFTVPTFIALWWFRTYDSRQQLQRANFEAGVGHIASDTPIRIEIGTQILIQVSKVTSAFDSEIALTFVKRLKRFPETSEKNIYLLKTGYRWSYAQHMLEWLSEDYRRRNKRYDLRKLDLRYQDFTSLTSEITICEVLKTHMSYQLIIDVEGCDYSVLCNFFGRCDSAHEQYDTHLDNLKKDPEYVRNHHPESLASNKLGTFEVTVSREDCNEQASADSTE